MVFETTPVIIAPTCKAPYSLYKRRQMYVVHAVPGEAVFIPTQGCFCLLILHVFIHLYCL